ncbi:hypothetical protein K435DRAFT_748255 [Dendrothele bispora CBS 962.96]|uniref:Uncharacterized protein n=1 Tax=Dendrothele bispora (strain CBS 962.96) TaxID=1314807 RepID=A0A4V4HHL6_DENBC|nr:hypothetical protein K435DRAFT_748255 [Dendrothele bispora CBS 962.96]
MTLPTELLREVVLFLLNEPNLQTLQASLEGFGVPVKPEWEIISSFSICSRTFRALALEGWFWTLRVKHPEDLVDESLIFPEIKTSWTRELHCVFSETCYNVLWNIDDFKHLRKIRFDLRTSRALNDSELLTSDRRLPFSNLTSTITELDLRGSSWPSPFITQSISNTFPSLKTLRMRQGMIWCGLCHTCSVPQFKEPGPEFIVYSDIRGLPVSLSYLGEIYLHWLQRHYSQTLSSLSNLQSIHLTVGNLASGETILRTGDSNNDIFWSGECDSCMALLYQDDTFRQQWVSKKQSFLDNPEFLKPPQLEKVEWVFWRLTSEDVHEYWEEISDTEGDDEAVGQQTHGNNDEKQDEVST